MENENIQEQLKNAVKELNEIIDEHDKILEKMNAKYLELRALQDKQMKESK